MYTYKTALKSRVGYWGTENKERVACFSQQQLECCISLSVSQRTGLALHLSKKIKTTFTTQKIRAVYTTLFYKLLNCQCCITLLFLQKYKMFLQAEVLQLAADAKDCACKLVSQAMILIHFAIGPAQNSISPSSMSN